jgi:Flp pilus assembly protein TadG
MKKRVSQKGSALVELALILPFFLVIAFGIIEYGLVMYDQAVITNASREAARSAIAFKKPKLTVQQIEDAADTYCFDRLISFGGSSTCSDVEVYLKDKDEVEWEQQSKHSTAPISNESETGVKVKVNYTYNYLVFGKLLGVLTGGGLSQINLSATTTMNNE